MGREKHVHVKRRSVKMESECPNILVTGGAGQRYPGKLTINDRIIPRLN